MFDREFRKDKCGSHQWRAVATLTREDLSKLPDIAERFDKNAKHFGWTEESLLYIFAETSVEWAAKRKEIRAFLRIMVHHDKGSAWLDVTAGTGPFRGKGAFQAAFDDLYFKVWTKDPKLKELMPIDWLSAAGQEKRRGIVLDACTKLIGTVPEVFVPPMATVVSQREIEERVGELDGG